MAVLSREPIETLYKDIRNYLQINATDAKATNTPEEIVASVTLFFTDLFPLAYHHSADISNKDFTLDYKECLKKSIDTISPFGDVPKQIAQSLSKSLEATRLLLQAFRIGTEVLNTTDTLLIDEHGASNPECHDALVKMTYCPKCLGMTKFTKPCSGYCLNVLRGCIAKYVAELDLPWNGYVEGIESLLSAMRRSNNDAGVNADIVIRNLDTKISAAIMHYMEKGKDIDARKVLDNFDKKLKSAGIYYDLGKSFDTIDHKVLLNKPNARGVHGPGLNWIASYLSADRIGNRSSLTTNEQKTSVSSWLLSHHTVLVNYRRDV
ncbi:hypothetical protein NQ314_011469 [Rhamnusium bicolor]|uniref:Glypican-5 n=1 Tax=Rhamnusium bicolor TaxID=1586634 RepID=A0AAV8XHH4_9CUCU|nr:hypothetical protein NQ314_011469 [Rhamnusium bicolor]